MAESLIMEHASETSCQPECSLLLHCQQSDASDEVTPNLDCMTEGKYHLNSVIIWLFVCVFFSPRMTSSRSASSGQESKDTERENGLHKRERRVGESCSQDEVME